MSSKQIKVEFKGVNDAVFAQVWEKMKHGHRLEGAEHILGRSMADHPHWYPYFETIGIFETPSHYPGDVNPFLHINLHLLVGLQILKSTPLEAKKFYLTRLKKHDEPHDIIHMMIEAFQKHLVWTAVHQGSGDVDLKAYAKTLKTLRTLKVDVLWKRLGHGSVPELHPEASLSS